MKVKSIKYLFVVLVAIQCCQSCKKAWLDIKPDQSLVVPETLKDVEAILNNTGVFNQSVTPRLGEMSSDDYYITSSVFQARNDLDRNVHTWAPGYLYGSTLNLSDWDGAYRMIYNSNVALETLAAINVTNASNLNWENLRGQALFFRAHAYYQLAQIFSKPYSKVTASTDLGLIVRTVSNINEPSIRFSVQASYEKILADLKEAKDLLTNTTPTYPTIPYRPAALALLARTYLVMENYDSALFYADETLKVKNTLVKYSSSYNSSIANPIPRYSAEIIFDCSMPGTTVFPHNNGQGIVYSTLYKSFSVDDARRTIFFKEIPSPGGRLAFCGSYSGVAANLFTGIATDEIYLIRAECNARKNNVSPAMADLNLLLEKRWKHTATFLPLNAVDAEDALRKILTERRKELCFRGVRWTDLRRLNMDLRFQKTLTRVINNQMYTLLPNDNRYVLSIPNSEILISGVDQNPR